MPRTARRRPRNRPGGDATAPRARGLALVQCGKTGLERPLRTDIEGIRYGRHSAAGDEGSGGQAARHVRMGARRRSEEHTSELQSLMRISYAVFCLKKKKTTKNSV